MADSKKLETVLANDPSDPFVIQSIRSEDVKLQQCYPLIGPYLCLDTRDGTYHFRYGLYNVLLGQIVQFQTRKEAEDVIKRNNLIQYCKPMRYRRSALLGIRSLQVLIVQKRLELATRRAMGHVPDQDPKKDPLIQLSFEIENFRRALTRFSDIGLFGIRPLHMGMVTLVDGKMIHRSESH